MTDFNLYTILLNCAYCMWLASFMSKDIVWLRLLTITGNIIVVPFYLYNFDNPLWISIFWVSVYTSINGFMLFLIYLERRPIQLSNLEQKIYDLTFKSLEPRVYKKIIDLGSWEKLEPDVLLVNRDSDLESLMLVVEGEVEVILKHGERKIIPTGGFIGEQSFITGQKTSADVTTGEEATQILRWNKETLRNFINGKETLKDNIDLILTADLIHKIRNMDQNDEQITHSQDLKIN